MVILSGWRGCGRTSGITRGWRRWATRIATRRDCMTTGAADATRSRGSSSACAREPLTRSATITTFQPLTDTSYIPCISLLDFWLRGGALELVVYAHSIDFGAKGYGNLVELAAVQRRVASALDAPVGRLVMVVKSAHIYATEREYMAAIVAARRDGGDVAPKVLRIGASLTLLIRKDEDA